MNVLKQYLRLKVEVIDEDICANCKKLKIVDTIEKRTDAYGMEVEERKIACAHKDLCQHLLEHIQEEKFLHID